MHHSTPLPDDDSNAEGPSGDISAEARWYAKAAAEFGNSLARMAAAHEFDRTLQQDLLQEIHLALWRSFAGFATNAHCALGSTG